jgi:hypothetical protein
MKRTSKMARALLLLALCLFASLGNVEARTYNVYATGEAPALSPNHWGIGKIVADL